jgi:hypothetical protein
METIEENLLHLILRFLDERDEIWVKSVDRRWYDMARRIPRLNCLVRLRNMNGPFMVRLSRSVDINEHIQKSLASSESRTAFAYANGIWNKEPT